MLGGGNWPADGEIDIMEVVGREPHQLFGTLHGPGYSGGSSYTGQIVSGSPWHQDFHTYAVDWSPNLIVWTVDGNEFFRATPESLRRTAAGETVRFSARLRRPGSAPPAGQHRPVGASAHVPIGVRHIRARVRPRDTAAAKMRESERTTRSGGCQRGATRLLGVELVRSGAPLPGDRRSVQCTRVECSPPREDTAIRPTS